MLGWAYACYIIYTKGMILQFLEYKAGLPSLLLTLLLNPITGIVVAIIAMFNAWEISLIVILFFSDYWSCFVLHISWHCRITCKRGNYYWFSHYCVWGLQV